uniref:Uncharacterized protein n=1 Tax=Meloidogyne enterolobii TaxID=390850 RepID=A0A6V7UEH6_MELEN|nr:unnamed protein product [Meloidogyne enterolobii]
MKQFSILLLLYQCLQDVDTGNCCVKAPLTLEQTIFENPPTQLLTYSSSADAEEKEIEDLRSSRREAKERVNKEIYAAAMKEFYEKNCGEWEQQTVIELEGEEAGPSQPKRKTKKTMLPNPEEIEFYVNQVLAAIGKHFTSNEAYDLITNSKDILNEIERRFSIRRIKGDTFLEVVYNKGRFFCNDWLLNKLKEADNLDRRSFSSPRYEGSQRAIQLPTREPNIRGRDIKKDKTNARIFCRFGAYLAMSKIIAENVLGDEQKNEIEDFIGLWKLGLKDMLPNPDYSLIHSEKIRERLRELSFIMLETEMREIIIMPRGVTKGRKIKGKGKRASGKIED